MNPYTGLEPQRYDYHGRKVVVHLMMRPPYSFMSDRKHVSSEFEQWVDAFCSGPVEVIVDEIEVPSNFVGRSPRYVPLALRMFFPTEKDVILFKLRWVDGT